MNNPHLLITLELSGTPLTGYRHVVPRTWALTTTRELLVASMKNALIDLCNMNNLWYMLNIIDNTPLHIHAGYNNNSSTIYVCTCENDENVG